MSEVLDLLRRARRRIAKRENWTQRFTARDALGHKVDADSDRAVCFCSIGALLVETPQPDSTTKRLYASRCLQRAKSVLSLGLPKPDLTLAPLASFNDTHTHEEVLAHWDRVIAKLEMM